MHADYAMINTVKKRARAAANKQLEVNPLRSGVQAIFSTPGARYLILWQLSASVWIEL